MKKLHDRYNTVTLGLPELQLLIIDLFGFECVYVCLCWGLCGVGVDVCIVASAYTCVFVCVCV